MKKLMKATLLFLCTFLFLTACGKEEIKEEANKEETEELEVEATEKEEPKKVVLASIGDGSNMIEWIADIVDPEICEVENMNFTENQLPAMALKEGEVDGFVANQVIWVGAFNDGNDANLTMLEPYIYYPGYGAYSTKHKEIESIPENGQVAIPSDPSNMERALLIMEGMDLIRLGDKTDKFYNLLDIEENYKNLEILETELTTTAASIIDVDFVICTANSIMEAGYSPIDDSLYDDPEAEKFSIGLVVQPEDVDSPWAKEIVRAMTTDEWREQFNDFYKGSRVLY